MSRGWSPDRQRKPFACWELVETEKSIWVQRLEVESRMFLHDRQTWVIVTSGPFIGKCAYDLHTASFSCMKKRGIRTKTSVGS